ncbi:MAG TPA: queuosine precursor transporter [Candidatus Nanopelagicales bacterium]
MSTSATPPGQRGRHPDLDTPVGPQHEPARAAVTGHFWVVAAVFCGLLLISNIGATKLIAVGPLITDGGAFLFPLVYVVGDVLSEVYGWRATRRVIWLAFGLSALAALTFLAVQAAPPATDWPNQEAFEAVLGFVPQIVLASLAGFVVGQSLNAWTLVRIKARTAERRLWVRLLGSTAVGEFADTLVFCTIAFYGVLTGWSFVNDVVVGYLYKVLVEVLVLPITYRVIALVKRHEPTYGVPVTAAAPVAT